MKSVVYLLKYAWKNDRKLCLITFLKVFFDALVPLIDIAGIGVVVDLLTEGAAADSVMRAIICYVVFHLAAALGGNGFALAVDLCQRKSTNKVQYQYAWDSIIMNYHYVQDGSFLDLKKKSMNVQPSFYLKDFGAFFGFAVKFAGITYAFARIRPELVLVLVLLSVIPILLSFRQKKAEAEVRKNSVKYERRGDYLYKAMTEYKFAKDIRIYSGQEMLDRKFRESHDLLLRKRKELSRKALQVKNISLVFQVLQTAVMLLYFTRMVYIGGITLGEYSILLSATALFVSLIFQFFDNLARIKLISEFVSLREKYDAFVHENSSIYQSNEKVPKGRGDFERFDIVFENVSFAYPGRTEKILDNISFRIKAGESIGLVGLNGAGKSTIIKLIARLYEPSEGVIKVNGVDIREIPLNEYCAKIGIVLQDYFLFAYSIEENIVFGGPADEKRVTDVLEKSGLKEKTDSLPKGSATFLYRKIDKDGIELSGGEGQKLALARALYKDAKMMILDEPTSALDPMAEYRFYQRMRELVEGRTSLLVSHRLYSTKYCDRILVLQKGKIVEEGAHDALLEQKGIYADLFFTQAKMYHRE